MRENIVKKIAELLRSFPEAQSWIFGSTARGDFKEDSDIDILILIPDYFSTKEIINYRQDILEALWPIELESGIEISPVILPHKIWNQRITPFTLNVNNDRIRI